MLKSTDTQSIAALHSALRTTAIRSGRDASPAQKASASLLAYFKTLVDVDLNVASLEQLVSACEAVGLIDKPIAKIHAVVKTSIASGMFRTDLGSCNTQIKISAHCHLPDNVDGLQLEKTVAANKDKFEKLVMAFLKECNN